VDAEILSVISNLKAERYGAPIRIVPHVRVAGLADTPDRSIYFWYLIAKSLFLNQEC
jgi:hypothetical protein